MMQKFTKLTKTWNLALQILIFLLSYGFIYQQVFHRDGFDTVMEIVQQHFNEYSFPYIFILIFIMMLINWGIETLKWQYLVSKVEKISYIRAFQAVLAGISISSFVPNRVGEFFGRAFYLKKADPVEGILVTIIGSMSQLIITILTGSVAFLFFARMLLGDLVIFRGYLFISLITLVIALDLLILGLFLNVSFLAALKERILVNGLVKLKKYFRVFDFYHNRELILVLFLSFTRYLVFSTQFYLLLIMFRVHIPFPEGMMLIAVIYFIMTVIPTIALTELGIRGSVAISIFGIYFSYHNEMAGIHSASVFAASSILWIINLGIPALLGGLFVFRLHFFRNNPDK